MAKALQQLSSFVSKGTAKIKNAMDTLQQSYPTSLAAHHKESSVSQSTYYFAPAADYTRQYNAVFYILP